MRLPHRLRAWLVKQSLVRNGGEGRIETDLDELEAAGLVDAEVRVYYRLTSEGRRRLKSSEDGLELEELVA